jgi:hypothetical protein
MILSSVQGLSSSLAKMERRLQMNGLGSKQYFGCRWETLYVEMTVSWFDVFKLCRRQLLSLLQLQEPTTCDFCVV